MSEEKKGPTIEELAGEETDGPKVEGQTQKPVWERIIYADTMDKPLEDYHAHPLNYNNEESTSRIIRGTEGIIGSLDKAVIDIVVGVFQKVSGFFNKDRTTQ